MQNVKERRAWPCAGHLRLTSCKLLQSRSIKRSGSDAGAGGDLEVLGQNHDPIPDEPVVPLQIGTAWEGADDHAFTDADILIQDGALNIAVRADADASAK